MQKIVVSFNGTVFFISTHNDIKHYSQYPYYILGEQSLLTIIMCNIVNIMIFYLQSRLLLYYTNSLRIIYG